MKHIKPLRKCKHCGLEAHTEDALELFTKDKHTTNGRRNRCHSCYSEIAQQYRLKNPDKIKEANKACNSTAHAKRYGISLEEYRKRIASSDKCECCGSKENLCYDHCHNSMEFRGILCRRCNAAIGGLGDTEEGVLNALTYLIAHREKQNENN